MQQDIGERIWGGIRKRMLCVGCWLSGSGAWSIAGRHEISSTHVKSWVWRSSFLPEHLEKDGDRWILGLCWPASLTYWCIPDTWRNTLSKSNGESKRRQQMLTSGLHPYLCCTPHPHAHKYKEKGCWQLKLLSVFVSLFRFNYFTLGKAALQAVPSA